MDDAIGPRRRGLQQVIRQCMHLRQQVGIAHQIRHPETGDTGLARTQEFAGTAQLQVFFGNDKAIIGLPQGVLALPRQHRQGLLIQQHTARRRAAAPNPPA